MCDGTIGRNNVSLKPKEKIYKIDHMLVNYGHTVVPLPHTCVT